MSTTSQITVSDLRSATEVSGAIAERRKVRSVVEAERFVRHRFGEEALLSMLRIKDVVDDRPTFVFCRQIGKPDLQHNALYLTAKALGYSILTSEWHNDFLTMRKGYYKRTYAKLPLAAVGREGSMYVRSISLVDAPLYGTRLKDVIVPGKAVDDFRKVVARIEPRIAEALEGRDHMLPEFHQKLRGVIEGNGQLAIDMSGLSECVAKHLIRKKSNMPGAENIVSRIEDGDRKIDSVGGQLMNIVIFAMQNLIPNMILAVTDWNHDDFEIRERYQKAVGFLEDNGLKEPLQVFIPSLATELKGHATSGSIELDYVTPAIADVAKIPKPQSDGNIGATYIGMGSAIIGHMMRKR
jgi:hypothetical protein